jgi:hypothetical protein
MWLLLILAVRHYETKLLNAVIDIIPSSPLNCIMAFAPLPLLLKQMRVLNELIVVIDRTLPETK